LFFFVSPLIFLIAFLGTPRERRENDRGERRRVRGAGAEARRHARRQARMQTRDTEHGGRGNTEAGGAGGGEMWR
jgi:hypothetical protein